MVSGDFADSQRRIYAMLRSGAVTPAESFITFADTIPTTSGGTGLNSFTAGDMLYYATGTALSKLVIGTSGYWMRSTGSAPAWTAPAVLSKSDDTNITLALSGSPNTALLNAVTITAGFTGTLAAGRLNANVVQSAVNDANVTGSISAQVLTFGWTGTLAAARLNANVVQSVVNDTNFTGSISAQVLTLGFTGSIADSRLATISTTGKVSNSATTAASANTASAIVARDASGNFSAGTITATLTGSISGNAATATALATGRTISITGDLSYTSPSFDGTGNITAAGTLASVASAGTTGSSTTIPVITINAKGLTTSITTAAVVAPAGTLSGTTLNSTVVTSSLTTVGALIGGSIVAGFGNINNASNSLTTGALTATTGNFSDVVKLTANASGKWLGFNGPSSTGYTIDVQGASGDWRFATDNDSGTHRHVIFGYYSTGLPTGTWNGKVDIDSFTGAVTMGTLTATSVDVQSTGNAITSAGNIIITSDTKGFFWRDAGTTHNAFLGSVKGWLGSGTNVTDAAIGSSGDMYFYPNGSGSGVVKLTSSLLTSNVDLTARDHYATRGDGTGVYYFVDGTNYIYYDATKFNFVRSSTTIATMSASAFNYTSTSTGAIATFAGANSSNMYIKLTDGSADSRWMVDTTGGIVNFGTWNSWPVAVVVNTTAWTNWTTLGLLTHTGLFKLSGIGSFASGDKYLVIDSSGNVHKSAIGPAS